MQASQSDTEQPGCDSTACRGMLCLWPPWLATSAHSTDVVGATNQDPFAGVQLAGVGRCHKLGSILAGVQLAWVGRCHVDSGQPPRQQHRC